MHSWTNDWEKFLDNLVIAYSGKVVKIHEKAHIEFMEWLEVAKYKWNVYIYKNHSEECIEISYLEGNGKGRLGQSIYEITKEPIIGGENIYVYTASNWDIEHFKCSELRKISAQNIEIEKKVETQRLKEIEEKLKSWW